MFDFIKEMRKNIELILVETAEIRKDVNYHIKRTDKLEDFVKAHTQNSDIHEKPLTVKAACKSFMSVLGSISLMLGVIWVSLLLLSKFGVI